MTLQEIKQAIGENKRVFWVNSLYEVIKDCKSQYLINCTHNDNAISLTWKDGITLNGKEKDFYIFEN